MSTAIIIPETLRLAYHCTACGCGMLPTRTIAGERSLTCPGCGHEVLWSTRFASCNVAELEPVNIGELLAKVTQ